MTRAGQDTSIEVWTLTDPPAGTYQVRTSLKGGIVTAIPLYAVSVQLDAPTPARPLVQYLDGEIRFKLLDSKNQPVLPTDNPTYNFDLQAGLTTASGETMALPVTLEAGSYRAAWAPATLETGVLHITAELTDVDHNTAWRCEGDAGQVTVDPVTVTANLPTECTPVNTAVNIPLQLADASNGHSAGTVSPVTWEAVSVTSGGEEVTSSVGAVDVKAGKYQLTINPVVGEDVRTHLTASVALGNRSVQIYDEELTTPVCPVPAPPPPPAPAGCGPAWNCMPWLLILLIVLVLTWPFLRRRDENERSPFWAALIILLVLLLLLAWLLWYCKFPSFPLWLLLVVLLGILLLWGPSG